MMTAFGSVDAAVEAMKHGAYDFVTKPLNIDRLEMLIQRALRSRKVEKEVVELKQVVEREIRAGAADRGVAGDGGGFRHDQAGGADAGDGADRGRERHGQGAGGAGDPCVERAAEAEVRGGALRGAVAAAFGKRAVRARARGFHRGGGAAHRALRAGEWRDDFPR